MTGAKPLSLLLFDGGHEAAVGDGGVVGGDVEMQAVEQGGVFGVGVAFALGDVHEEGGVFGDGDGAGFVVVEEGPVDDEEAVGGKGGGGFLDELAGFGEIPVVEEIGEEDDIGGGPGVGEHVGGEDLDAVLQAVSGDLLAGDGIDGGLFEDGGGELGIGGDEGGGIDAGAAADVEEVVFVGEEGLEGFGEGLAEEEAAAVHEVGEVLGEGGVFHGLVPVVGVVLGLPVGGFAGVEDLEVALHDGGVADRFVVGAEEPGGVADEVFPAEGGEAVLVSRGGLDESVGAAEGEEDVEGASGEVEVRGDVGGGGVGMFVQPGEEVEMEEGGGDEFGGVLAIAEVEDPAGIGGGEGGENGAHWWVGREGGCCALVTVAGESSLSDGADCQVYEAGGEGASGFSRGGAVIAEVFFAAVAEPDAEGLGDLFAFGFGELFVELEGAVTFAAAGLIVVGVPVGAGEADASGGFLDEGGPGEVGVVLFVFFGGHGGEGRGEGVREVEGLRR